MQECISVSVPNFITLVASFITPPPSPLDTTVPLNRLVHVGLIICTNLK